MNQPAKKKKEKTEIVPINKNLPKQRDININLDPQYLIQTAIQNNSNIEVLERLLDVRDRLRKEQAETLYRKAMAEFQAECPVIMKRKKVFNKEDKGGDLRYKYAPIDDIIKQVGPLISKRGFSYDIQTEQILEPIQMVKSTIKISHIAGHTETSSFSVPVDAKAFMTEPQKWLSGSTFSKRIAFCNGFGIITGDDDNDANEDKDKKDKDKKQAEANKKRQEAINKLNALPENIKKGFEVLDYKSNTQWQFCEDRKWDHARIYADINKIVDKRA